MAHEVSILDKFRNKVHFFKPTSFNKFFETGNFEKKTNNVHCKDVHLFISLLRQKGCTLDFTTTISSILEFAVTLHCKNQSYAGSFYKNYNL